MAIVNFTTYTGADPDSDYTIISNKITFTQLDVDLTAYNKFDYGVGAFGDFVHRLKVRFEAESTDFYNPECLVWGLQNNPANLSLEDIYVDDDGIGLTLITNGSIWGFALRDIEDSTSHLDVSFGALPWERWVEIERAGTTLTAKIYTDAYSTLESTLTQTVSTTTYRYHNAATGGSNVTLGDAGWVSGYIEDLNMVSPGIPDVPSGIVKPNFRMARAITQEINMYGPPSTGMGLTS